MVKFYKFKAKHVDYFCSKSPLEYKELLSQNFITILEERDESGRRIILAKIGKPHRRNKQIKLIHRNYILL
jgi:hypothetical protein